MPGLKKISKAQSAQSLPSGGECQGGAALQVTAGASAVVGSRMVLTWQDYRRIQFPLRKPAALLNSLVWRGAVWRSAVAGP